MTTTTVDPRIFETAAFWQDPYPTLRLLRDHAPLYHDSLHNVWWISRYDDVVDAFRDTVHYSNRIFEKYFRATVGPTIVELDGEAHARRRNIVAPELAGRKLESLLGIVERNAAELIARFTETNARSLAGEFAGCGEVDLIGQFSTRLPAIVMLDVMGLPKTDHDRFHEWYTSMQNGINGSAEQRVYGAHCNSQFHAYIDPLLDARAVAPGDDLLSRLCVAEVDGERMSREDIKGFASLMLMAGGDTTDKAVSNLWYHFMHNPDQFAEVQRDPSLLDRAFTETMRISPPAGFMPRETAQEVQMYGQTVPAGVEVQLSIFSANHDERVFHEPERFDMYRKDLYFGRDTRAGHYEDGTASHLGFGLGKHFCVGYQLARAEAVIGSRTLLDAIKNPRLKPGTTPQVQLAGAFNVTEPKLELIFDIA